jgi:prophage antirepressor-like protein
MTASTMITLHYEDEPVRVVMEEDGSLWFVVKDIGDILGYCNALNLLNGLAPDASELRVVKTSRGRRKVRVVTSAGVFWMLHRTKWEATPGLLHWLEREVLNVSLKPGAWVQGEVVREG